MPGRFTPPTCGYIFQLVSTLNQLYLPWGDEYCLLPNAAGRGCLDVVNHLDDPASEVCAGPGVGGDWALEEIARIGAEWIVPLLAEGGGRV